MKRVLPYLILFCALGLSSAAAFYSVLGLSILFAGVKLPVLIMGSFLEASKVVIATTLHNYWKSMNRIMRGYLIISIIILSLITSAGIYGLLSEGYQSTANKIEIVERQIDVLETKRDRFDIALQDYIDEKSLVDENISELRTGLISGTVIQYKDKETGQIISTSSSSARKAIQEQIDASTELSTDLSIKIEALNDSIMYTDLAILEIENTDAISAEIGPLKYVSKLVNQPVNTVINWFILLIIFVFDPLAITLVVAASFAFGMVVKRTQYSKKADETEESPIIKNIDYDTIFDDKESSIETEEIPIKTEEIVNKNPNKPNKIQGGPIAGPY